MAQKVYLKNENLGLGFMSLPILEFNERLEILNQTSSQLDPQAKAATVYFGMLADSPKPTAQVNAYAVDWKGTSVYKDGSLTPKEDWYEREKGARYTSTGYFLVPFVEMDAQNAYLINLNNLQEWLIYKGLWAGIQKTLNEESRKLQAQAAAASAAAAAAARALAMSRINADISEEARIEAAENSAKANKQLEEAQKDEAEIKQKISDLENGIITTKKTSSFGTIAAILAGAAALLFLG